MKIYREQNGCHNCISLYTVSSFHKGIEKCFCKKGVDFDSGSTLAETVDAWSTGREIQPCGICDDWRKQP